MKEGRQETIQPIPVNVTDVSNLVAILNYRIQTIQRLIDGILGKHGEYFTLTKILTSAPSLSDLDNGESVYVDDGTNRRLYMRFNDTLSYIDVTDV